MLRGDWHAGACVIASLYLAYGGLRPAPSRRWPKVADCLTQSHALGNVHNILSILRGAGLWEEASLFDEPGRFEWAEKMVEQGRCITIFDSRYPLGWVTSLGSMAPPAVWVEGEIPSAQLVGVVGSRELPFAAQQFALSLGRYLVQSNRGVVTGGARGSDQLGASGAFSSCNEAPVVMILPCGFESLDSTAFGSTDICLISAYSPHVRFSGVQALLRNRLIYSWSRRTVVIHSRLGVGGTWAGATDCLRRGLGQILVADWGDPASQALISLGGQRVIMGSDSPWQNDLEFHLRAPVKRAQPDLFGLSVVREGQAPYERFATCPS